MPTTLADIMFWVAAAVIAAAQLFVLRSTWRGMKIGPPGSGSALEWAFAVVPALCLLGLLIWTWRTMHAGVFTFNATTPKPGVTA